MRIFHEYDPQHSKVLIGRINEVSKGYARKNSPFSVYHIYLKIVYLKFIYYIYILYYIHSIFCNLKGFVRVLSDHDCIYFKPKKP